MASDSSVTGLDQLPVTRLKGVGTRNADRLAKLGIYSVQDVLFHLPLRYQDRTRVVPIGTLRPGDQGVIEAQVEIADVVYGRRRSLLVRVADGSGAIILRFFHFSKAQRSAFVLGTRLRCFGEARRGRSSLEMVHPEYRRLEGSARDALEEALTPIYPTTEGMHQLTWRSITGQALHWLQKHPDGLQEWLPAKVIEERGLPTLAEAVEFLHHPPPEVDLNLLQQGLHPAQQRLAFEELLAHQVGLKQQRQQQRNNPAPQLNGSRLLRDKLLAQLTFELTEAQQRVATQISDDLTRSQPMMRLIQGDVGSGKTVVAALAVLQAVEAGYQVAIMVPTEILTEQHVTNFAAWFEPLGIRVIGLTGRHKGRVRERLLLEITNGDAQVVIGTHALFQDDVGFSSLGLVVIDEQHRFGVHQRMALREKGRKGSYTPHQLIMTATPIPRTLAMIAYADLDISVIDQLPPGRKPVTTVAIPDSRRDEVLQRVRAACGEGRQTYWVCTLIEESEALACQAAEDTAAMIKEQLPKVRSGLVHGRLKAAEKEAVMSAFKRGEIDLLVATTVIEVGVDVPNASLMVIENPERLGLAQIHQLRGRVGRGAEESHCVLMYHAPLTDNAKERLRILRESSDGFLIAKKDLQLRGPGEVLGTRQTGEMQFRIADLARDQSMLPAVQQVATLLLDHYPERITPLLQRWIGQRTQYINA